LIKVSSNINIALLDGVVSILLKTFEFAVVTIIVQFWLEQDLGGSESLIADKNLSTIGELIILLASVALFGFLHSCIIVVNNITHFFFDILHNLDFSIGCERVTALVEDLLKVRGDVSTREVNSLNGMWNSVTLIDWDSM